MARKSKSPAAGGGEALESVVDVRSKGAEIATNADPVQAPAVRVEPIPLARIKDGGAQMRVEMRPETINDYATDLLDGAVFPPVIVFHDGCDFWLADGFHRVEANRKIGRETIFAEIREGSSRDAVLHGIGSNAEHGLRRTQADKRRAVERLLKDPNGRAGLIARSPKRPRSITRRSARYARSLAGNSPPPAKNRMGNSPPSTASRTAGRPCSATSSRPSPTTCWSRNAAVAA